MSDTLVRHSSRTLVNWNTLSSGTVPGGGPRGCDGPQSSMTIAAGSPRLGRADVISVVSLVVAATGVPLWLAAASGSIGLPTSDDWVYATGATNLFRNGIIEMPQHTAASVGHLLMVQPLLWLSGGNPWAFTAFGLVMAGLAAASTYLLARRFVGVGSASLVVLLVIAFPGLARASASFMTDVPTLALILLCLLQGVRWLEGGTSRVTLATSLGVGVLAVSIREFAIAAPVAILTCAWLKSRSFERVLMAATTLAFVVGVAGVLLLAASIPGREAPTPKLVGFLFLGPTYATLASVLLPALVIGLARRSARLRAWHVLLGTFVALAVSVVPWGFLGGNMWMQKGFAGDSLLSGVRSDVIDLGAWALSRQTATFGMVLLAAAAILWADRRLAQAASVADVGVAALRVLRSPEGLMVLFIVGYSAEIVLFAPFFVYDRYLVPLVPIAAILLLRGRPQAARPGPSLAMAHVAFGWVAFSALLIGANSFAYDAARWRAGLTAVAAGYPASGVDAGYEWVGTHSSGRPKPGAPADNMVWLGSRWALIRPCAVVSNAPLEDPDLHLIEVDRAAYRQYLFFGPEQGLYLYGASKSQRCGP